jgi:hypothetical protein
MRGNPNENLNLKKKRTGRPKAEKIGVSFVTGHGLSLAAVAQK